MFLRLFLILIVLVSPLHLGFGPPKLIESDKGKMPIYPQGLRLFFQGRPPDMAGKAALVMDGATGKVVYQRNVHMRLAPASITKVMTAIVALEKGNLKDKVEIKAQHLVEGSSMGLIPGDLVSLEDLLWGLLLPSGNDAALAIAEHVGGGSVNSFVKMMNEKVQELGLRNTQFVNPHGLDEDGHFSSAYDLAMMSRYALSNPVFAKMVSTQEITIRASRTFTLYNNNRLLGKSQWVPGVDGVKTGLTDNSGDSLVASATRNGHRVIVVVLGTHDRTGAAVTLIDYAFSQFIWVTLKPPLFPYLDGSKGERRPVALVAPGTEMVPLWLAPYFNMSVKVNEGSSSLRLGEAMGAVAYSAGGSELTEKPLYYSRP